MTPLFIFVFRVSISGIDGIFLFGNCSDYRGGWETLSRPHRGCRMFSANPERDLTAEIIAAEMRLAVCELGSADMLDEKEKDELRQLVTDAVRTEVLVSSKHGKQLQVAKRSLEAMKAPGATVAAVSDVLRLVAGQGAPAATHHLQPGDHITQPIDDPRGRIPRGSWTCT